MLSYPLTLVEAPMGYGKTTYVKEYISAIPQEKALWLKVLDSNLYGFWKGFCRQLGQASPKEAEELDALGFPTDSSTRHMALQFLESIRFNDDTVLVIDDYHMVACPEVNEWIVFLVKHEIPKFRIVLVARHTGLMDVTELSLKRQLLHIGKEAFEFQPKDIRRYYLQCGIRLKEAEAQELYQVTEGWVSALYLILLDRQGKSIISHQTDIDRLMEHAIYRHLSDETKEMLLSLCLFEGFTLEQAVFISQNPQAEALLNHLVDRRAFVRYDNENGIYLIHNLFMNFLQDQLEKTQLQQSILQRAAQWHLKTGNFGLAQHYYYACGDFNGLFNTFQQERHTGVNYPYNREMLIKAFIGSTAEVRKNHPMAMLVLAFELYSYHELAYFQEICQTFVENLEKDHLLKDEVRNQLMGEYELLMSFTDYNDISRMSQHHLKACNLLQHPSFLLPKRGIWTFGSPSILYMFYRESGTLSETVNTLFEAMPLYSGATNGNARGGEYCMRAESALNAGDYGSALIDSYQALQLAESEQQLSNVLCALFIQLRVALMTGDQVQAIALTRTMHQRMASAREYLYLHTIEACEGWLYSMIQQESQIPRWLAEGDFSSDRLLFPNYAFLNIIYGRALLLRGEWHKLIGSRDAFLGVASVFPNLLGQIYTWIYSAVAYRQLLRDAEALAAMKTALELAIPDKVYLPFAENCDYIRPLLNQILETKDYQPAIGQIFAMHTQSHRSSFQAEGNGSKLPRTLLTERETEIAELAAEGLSNREIGERLFITQNTVKTQLKRIFEKLEISSRATLSRALKEKEANGSWPNVHPNG